MPVYPFGDVGKGEFHLRKGAGQVRQSDGTVLSDLGFFYENSPVGIYLRSKSTVSFVLDVPGADSTALDTTYRVDMQMGTRQIQPLEAGPSVGGLANYYLGDIVAEEVKAYAQAVYPEVSDSVDVHFTFGTSGPRMAIVIRPGGDPSTVRLKFNGQDSLHVDWQGALKAYIGQKWIRFEQAIAYQIVGGVVVPMPWVPSYEYADGTAFVAFEFLDYDPSLPLVFLIGYPPMPMGGSANGLCWSTYFGGSSAIALTLDTDNAGNLYVGGSTQTSEFPATVGTTTNPGGFYNSGVAAKFNAAHQLVWATYYGGTDSDEIKTIAHSSYHSALLFAGFTHSIDLPTQNLSGTYFDATYNGSVQQETTDAFIGRFLASTGQLSYASYWGTFGDDRAHQIVCDNAGIYWLVGLANTGMPLSAWASAFYSTFQGGISDGFVARFNAAGGLVWSTYIGGGNNEGLNSACLDDDGNLFVGGHSRSSNFPTVATCGTILQTTFAGGQGDCVMAKFSPSGQLCWSTYLGGGDFDFIAQADGIAVGEDRVYFIANTYSTDFPTIELSDAFNQDINQGVPDGAVICLDKTTLSAEWVTFVGGSDYDQLEAVGLDSWGNAYISGHSASAEYPTATLTGAYNQNYAGGGPAPFTGDAVLTAFSYPSHACTWSTFVGGDGLLNGEGNDAAYAISVQGASQVFIAGTTFSTFPSYPTYDPGGGAYFSALQPGGGMALSCFDIGSFPIGIVDDHTRPLAGLTLFPNPSESAITIVIGSSAGTLLQVLDATGRVVIAQPISPSLRKYEMGIAALAPGAYVVRISDGLGTTAQASLIKP